MSTPASTLDLDTAYTLSPEHVARFQRDGYLKLKHVLSAEVLDQYGSEITREVLTRTRNSKPLAERGIYGKAFLQVMNLWTLNDVVHEFVHSRRLARIATGLLQTQGVRLYHDQALYKEAGGSYTPWHVDQQYWPLATEKTVTAWIPLHPVPVENGTLSFSVGSQRIKIGRDLEISEASEKQLGEMLKISDLPIDETPYDLGEVSFHLGFTFHRAGPNQLDRPREVMTIIYMDSAMTLGECRNKNQKYDAEQWCPGVKTGEIVASPLNPVLYSSEDS